ncbi:histidine phosphatase family protein [Roseivirga sp. E12]|uniref:SixA phosphatase family protein n=1 Tax=Roseivirga sp. E12 TaxID=2819237 RepID=UPI001ABC14A3|nr:histidine phosphatase family protein [Roseivirga sp. E12]MBO3697043.1 histidine phosphatase family protein [Roseivirga sp. E12]
MVKNLFLIRHAEAEFPDSDKRDFDRRLTGNGMNQATILGEHIQKLPLKLDAIYLSPAIRTLMTGKLVVEQMDYTPRLMDAEELYEATQNLMRAFVNRIDPLFNNVAIIAHNPSIAQLFASLTMTVRDYSPATCTWIELPVDDWKAVASNMGIEKDYYYPGMS